MLRFFITKPYLWVFALMVAWLFIACNNSADTHGSTDTTFASVDSVTTSTSTTSGDTTAVTADSAAYPGTNDTAMVAEPDTTSIARYDSTNTPRPDTSRPRVAPGVIDTIKKSATLGLSFYDQMRLHEIKPLTVYVSVKNGHARLREEIRTREEHQNINRSQDDTSVVHTLNIDIYERLTVTLHYDTSDFAITPLSKATQVIDSTGTTRWTWNVKAISTKERSSTITVVLDPEPRIGGRDDLGPVNFKVKIRFSFWDMVRSWVVWLGENPQVTIPTILVPAVAWFFNRRRKQKANTGQAGEA